MLRIGILGSDNSHAERFSELLNCPEHPRYLPPEESGGEARVVAIWGQEAARTQEVAQKTRIERIVAAPEDMLDHVDAVFCVTRHGGLHRELVQPYLEAGVPTFVDKPLAVDPADARAMVEMAEAAATPLASFSTVQFSADAQRFLAAAHGLSGVRAAIYVGPASRRNPYGGVIFYAIHCIELMLAAQGTDVQWVQAVEGPPADDAGNGTVVATCAWADGATATLELTVGAKYCFRATALGREDIFDMTLDISDCYREGMKRILAFLRGGENPVALAAAVEAVQIGAAIERSLEEGARVGLAGV